MIQEEILFNIVVTESTCLPYGSPQRTINIEKKKKKKKNLPHEPNCFIMLKIQDMKMQEHMKVIQEFGQTLCNSGADRLSRCHALVRSTLLTNSHPDSSKFPQNCPVPFLCTRCRAAKLAQGSCLPHLKLTFVIHRGASAAGT